MGGSRGLVPSMVWGRRSDSLAKWMRGPVRLTLALAMATVAFAAKAEDVFPTWSDMPTWTDPIVVPLVSKGARDEVCRRAQQRSWL